MIALRILMAQSLLSASIPVSVGSYLHSDVKLWTVRAVIPLSLPARNEPLVDMPLLSHMASFLRMLILYKFMGNWNKEA